MGFSNEKKKKNKRHGYIGLSKNLRKIWFNCLIIKVLLQWLVEETQGKSTCMTELLLSRSGLWNFGPICHVSRLHLVVAEDPNRHGKNMTRLIKEYEQKTRLEPPKKGTRLISESTYSRIITVKSANYYTPVWKTRHIMLRGLASVCLSVHKLSSFQLTPPTVYIQSSWNLVYS